MKTPCVLAIDQGTGSTKCLLVASDGQVIARGSASIGERCPQPGWVDQDPEEIWQSVQDAVQACLFEHPDADLQAIGLSTQRESYLLWERETGRAVAPLISWQDRRTVETCQRLRTPSSEKMVREKTGLPLDPMFSASKAAWLLETHDPTRARAKRGELCLGTVESWLLYRMTGEHLSELGNASRTQLLNIHSSDWDEDLLELFNVPRAALPSLIASNGPYPQNKNLKSLEGVPIHAVMGDSHAALFAHGAFEPGAVKATYGTGSSIMGLIAETRRLDPGLCLTIAWNLHGQTQYAAEGNIRSSGSTLRWLADLLESTPAKLAELAATLERSPVTVVPAFGGLGAPWWDEQAVGLISDLSLGTSRADLAYAALDSIAQQVTDVLEAVDRSVGQVHHLHADGGATANDQLMQLQANLIGRNVRRSQNPDLSAMGAAHLAGLGAGFWTWDELKQMPREQDEFKPVWTDSRREQQRRQWSQAVARARVRKT
jgi:glycerol kinase